MIKFLAKMYLMGVKFRIWRLNYRMRFAKWMMQRSINTQMRVYKELFTKKWLLKAIYGTNFEGCNQAANAELQKALGINK